MPSGFEVVEPRSLREAARALREPGARLLAGGTDLVPKLKRGQLEARRLVDLRLVPGLSGARAFGSGLWIGSSTTVGELAESRRVEPYTALVEAARSVGTPAIRSRATLGGNLCLDMRCRFFDQSRFWREALGGCLKAPGRSSACRVAPRAKTCLAALSGDLPTALVALGARVRLFGLRGERELPLEGLYAGDGVEPLAKRADELVTAVVLPGAAPRSTYLKLRRRGSFDFGSLGAAVALRVEDGLAAGARIALGGVGPSPVLCDEAARSLEGRTVDAATAGSAAALAARRARPVDNLDFSPSYRRAMASALVFRALRRLAGSEPEPEPGRKA